MLGKRIRYKKNYLQNEGVIFDKIMSRDGQLVLSAYVVVKDDNEVDIVYPYNIMKIIPEEIE